jgi:hypothetical protein
LKTKSRQLPLILLGLTAAHPTCAGTLSQLAFTSNGGAYINDTVLNANTSPLAFTRIDNLNQPFLNAADSTVSLDYGNYFAIAFRGFGAHLGPGTISFLLDGTTEYSLSVTFPDPTIASGPIAVFDLPGGDTVTISATGLAEDRIQIIADGGGLSGDGIPDAFYAFNYSARQPTLTITPASSGLAAIAWSPATPGFVLQNRQTLASSSWSNSPSGATNPVIVSTVGGPQFFRLIRP